MIVIRDYETEEERTQIIAEMELQGLWLTEEQFYSDGKHLVFIDEDYIPPVSPTEHLIGTNHIEARAITTEKINDANVTFAKLATEVSTLFTGISASATLVNSNDTAQDVLSTDTTYTKKKETKLDSQIPDGTIRIKFQLVPPVVGTVYGQLYRNGDVIGAERSRTGMTGIFSQDFDCSAWAIDDLIQIYCKTSDSGEYDGAVNNFRFYYDIDPTVSVTNQDP